MRQSKHKTIFRDLLSGRLRITKENSPDGWSRVTIDANRFVAICAATFIVWMFLFLLINSLGFSWSPGGP
ncbi:hypothetical protein [Methylobacterium tarhaniae]|uniref:hypothetical protein n=1 Tax=Methylobacterium tarhaniae TaxID=1187852 RepID=UPI003D05FD33